MYFTSSYLYFLLEPKRHYTCTDQYDAMKKKKKKNTHRCTTKEVYTDGTGANRFLI